MPLRKSSNPVQTYYKNKAKRESSKRTAQQRIANQKHQLNRIYICDQKQNLESAIWIYYVEAKGSKAQQSIYLYAQQSKRQRINQQKGSERWVKSCCNLESKAQNWKLLQSWAKSTKIESCCNLNQKAQNGLESGCNLNQKNTEWTWKRLQSESKKHRERRKKVEKAAKLQTQIKSTQNELLKSCCGNLNQIQAKSCQDTKSSLKKSCCCYTNIYQFVVNSKAKAAIEALTNKSNIKAKAKRRKRYWNQPKIPKSCAYMYLHTYVCV